MRNSAARCRRGSRNPSAIATVVIQLLREVAERVRPPRALFVPFPHGYRLLPANRIAHVHAKDCYMKGHKPEWGPLGACGIDWKGQIAALLVDGYRGYLSLETHWDGPAGDKLQGSTICGWNMKHLAAT